MRNDGDDSSQKTQTCHSKPDLASLHTCNMTVPLIIDSAEQPVKPCDPSQEVTSRSSKTSGTGCSPAAHAHDLDPGPPTRPLKSLNTKQALKSKPSVSANPHREKPEAQRTLGGSKRVRRTWVKHAYVHTEVLCVKPALRRQSYYRLSRCYTKVNFVVLYTVFMDFLDWYMNE